MSHAGVKRKRSEDDGGPELEGDTVSRTVYAAGFPFSATEPDIGAFFKDCGEIVEIRAPVWHDSGKLRGYAHVEFATAKAAKAALELDGKYMGERFVSVELAKPAGKAGGAALPARPSGCTTLFVKGLPYEMDEAGLKAAFEKYGRVLAARLGRWNHTGQTKGFGYVQFEHGFTADAVAKMYSVTGSLTVGGRRVTLDWDTGAPKASYRTADKQYYNKTEEGEKAIKVLQSSSGGGGGSGHASSSAAASGGADESSGPSDAKKARRKAEKAEKKRQMKVLKAALSSGGAGEGGGSDGGSDAGDGGGRSGSSGTGKHHVSSSSSSSRDAAMDAGHAALAVLDKSSSKHKKEKRRDGDEGEPRQKKHKRDDR